MVALHSSMANSSISTEENDALICHLTSQLKWKASIPTNHFMNSTKFSAAQLYEKIVLLQTLILDTQVLNFFKRGLASF